MLAGRGGEWVAAGCGVGRKAGGREAARGQTTCTLKPSQLKPAESGQLIWVAGEAGGSPYGGGGGGRGLATIVHILERCVVTSLRLEPE